jgi:metal-responsive CopG/Arc/MetJ family transcriptional regulator
MSNNRTISICLPEALLSLIEQMKVKRHDPTRSDTIRVLILHGLADFDLLPDEVRAALGIRRD